MLTPDTVLRLLDERRCLKTTRPLRDGEFLLARSEFPRLYSGESHEEEAIFLGLISSQLQEVFHRATADQRIALRAFMQLVLRNGRMHKEDFVHRFIFEYWNDLWGSEQERYQLSERYFKGQAMSKPSQFVLDIVSRVYKSNEHVPDILGVSSKSTATVFIIEIKNEPLDDRALGQILRYYQVVRSVCDRFRHRCDVRRVTPVLIVPRGDQNFWNSIPFHFREIVEIFYWRSNADGSLKLVDGKQSLRDEARGMLMHTPGG